MATSLKAGMDHLIGGMQTGPKNIGRVNKFYMLSVKFRSALVETIEKNPEITGQIAELEEGKRGARIPDRQAADELIYYSFGKLTDMAINAVRRTDNDDNAKIREEFFVDIYASAMEEMRPKEIKVSPAPPIVFNDTLSYGTEAIGDMEPVGACVFEPVAARINKEKRNVSFVFGEDGVDVLNDAALSAMPGRTCYIEPKMPETAQPKPKFMTKEYFASKLSEFWGWATGKTENDRLFAPNPLIRTYAPAVEPAIRMAETIPSGKPFYAKAAWKGILSVLERMRGSVMAKDGFTSPKFSFQVVKINDYVE